MKCFGLVLLCCVLVQGYSIDQHDAQVDAEASDYVDQQRSIFDNFDDCPEDDDLTEHTTLACHGVKLARRAMGQLIEEGVKVVDVGNGSRAFPSTDRSAFGRVQEYLKNHEVQFKLQDMLPNSEQWGRAIKGGLAEVHEASGRGKKKKELGNLIAMALMMKGMLAAIGFKALALLTMKALGMATLALALAGLVALKTLASKGGSGHVTVIPVASGGGHGGGEEWRRRVGEESMNNTPYRGYEVYEKPE